jgi:hypothetical protein
MMDGTYRPGTVNDILTIKLHFDDLIHIWAGEEGDDERIAELIWKHGFEPLKAKMTLMLKDCPKTSKVEWRDFKFFHGRFEFTLGNAEAWQRKIAAQKGAKQFMAADPETEADPLWGTDGITEARILKRKPKTAAERRSLIELRCSPKKNWQYIAKFLAQDNCPKCGGGNAGCECVLDESVVGTGSGSVLGTSSDRPAFEGQPDRR